MMNVGKNNDNYYDCYVNKYILTTLQKNILAQPFSFSTSA